MVPNWFIAWPVDLPAAWLAALEPPPRVRVFDPGDLHATIAFLGGVGEEAARLAFDALPDELGPPLHGRWGAIVPMGNPRRPSALSAELSHPEAALRTTIATLRPVLLDAAGARPDTRPPRPHVTVARPQRRATDPQRRAAVDWAERLDPPVRSVRLDRVALYTWTADRRQRLFRIVEARALRGET